MNDNTTCPDQKQKEKNKHLEDWRWINLYPYNERWVLEEQIKEARKPKTPPNYYLELD